MFNVVAFAGEICNRPEMPRLWNNEFGDDPRLTICARRGDAARLRSTLDRAFAELEPAVSSRRQHTTHIDKVRIPEVTRQEMVEAYRADGARLMELFPDLDLGLWTSLQTEQTASTT